MTIAALPDSDVHAMNPERVPLAVEALSVSAADRNATSRTLVRDVMFSLGAGETLGLVGESGSGKSMTARAIAGLLPETVRASGSIRLGDIEVVGAPERALRRLRGTRVSLLLQDPFTMLNPLQTASATIAESLPRTLRRNRRLLHADVQRRLLEVGVDPESAGRRYPFQLSGGMRQRVALAAALAKDPEVLIADEPTTALDVTTQQEVLRLLAELRETRGLSLLLITHDLAVAFGVCDRVLVLYAGSVMEYGDSSTLAERPAHPYTARLRKAHPPAGAFVEPLQTIPGRVPAPDAVAAKCAFADRCDWAQPVCFATRPLPRRVGIGHLSACVRFDAIRDELSPSESAPSSRPVSHGAADSTLLEIAGLYKAYRTVGFGRAQTTQAVRDVSLRIGSGEAVGLVGESGSGKTSIARCIVGLTTPDAGSIRIGDTDTSDYNALGRTALARVRRTVQMVFQDPYASLNPRLTIGATLEEALGAHGSDPGAGGVAELLDLVGLPTDFATRRPRALSGGERQRVAIARALAVEPQLLICDEPVASLDVSVQAQVLELLRMIRRSRRMSMLFITHDLAVVRQMTERVIVLYGGEVVEEGPTDAVLDAPGHPYTQRLLDAVAP